jgi:predicted AlkP superfamily phosphohydrolase/phosphomutase
VRSSALAVLAALGLAAGAPSAEAWGFTAHRIVNRKAVATLPPTLRPLFEANLAYLAEHSTDPDLWRAAGQPGEWPNHYLDMDAFGAYPFPNLPRVEAQHLAKNGAAAAERGRVPWRVGEVYRELVAAFKAGDAPRILERAAILGHYVGDAHVPFHAVLNYDGQLSGQTGIHERWERFLVERFERQLEPEVRPQPATRVADPIALIFAALLESFQAAPDALASDRACAGPLDRADTPEDDRYGDAYYTKFFERERTRLEARLAASAQRTGSLWFSAWIDAGRPALPAFRFSRVRKSVRGVLLSIDGASAPVIDDAVARGVMPQLARLRARGSTARGSISSIPSKTAPGHAALFTGTWSAENGIEGNDLPVPGGSVLERISGYTSEPLKAEPVWVTVARQGLDASVASGTQLFPFTPYLEGKRFGGNYGRHLTLMDGYRDRGASDAAYRAADLRLHPAEGWTALPAHAGEAREFALSVTDTEINGLLFDDPADPVAGFDTLLLGVTKDAAKAVRLKPQPAQGPDPSAFASLALKVRGEDAGAQFRLFALAPDGSEVLLYRSRVQSLLVSGPGVAAAAFEATTGFVGNGAPELYGEGGLGPPLWKGGDGTAERRYLETVGLVVRQMERLADFTMDRTPWDLLVGYLPYPDEALHVWLGYLEPSLPRYDPALAARLRPFLDETLRAVDAYLGHVVERAGNDTIVAVAADHGLVGVSSVVRPNAAFARAGLLALNAAGQVDLTHTRAIYFASGYVLINHVSRKGGIVAPEDADAVRAEVERVLRAIVDPATGKPAVVDVIDPRRSERGFGGPNSGDIYFMLAPSYDAVNDLAGDPVGSVAPMGVHFQDPLRFEMQAAFTVSGPGVAAGVDLGTIRQIDVAPTLCALMGLGPPAQAKGSVLEKALRP